MDVNQEDVVVSRKTPDIPGLYIFPDILHDDIAHSTLEGIAQDDFFSGGQRDQVMLFEDAAEDDEAYDPILEDDNDDQKQPSISTLPQYLLDLLLSVRALISPRLPLETFQTIFDQPLSRQVILNLYRPGKGISPHIDLSHRYADGILGVSLCGGCVMLFSREGEVRRVYIPAGSVYCLTGEARWDWAHGIDGRMEDLVRDQQGREVTMIRELRVSVTYRWMKQGADELVELAPV